MLNINKVRKAQQGQLLNARGLEYKQSTIPATIDFNLEIQGLKTNPYMKPKPEPTQKNQNLYNILGQGMDFMGNIFSQDQNGYQGTYGSWKQAGNQIYNQISNTVSSINPIFGLGLKGLGLINNLTPGTDAMTKQDAILDSIPLLKQINSGLGKSTKDFSINQDTLSQVGGDFTGSTKDILNAKDKANKKYGLFSNRARQKANSQIQDAQNQQNKMTEIANESRDLQSIVSNMSDLNSLNYLQKINGGIDFRYTRAAKSGTKLSRIKKLQLHKIGGIINQSINVDTKEIEDTWVPTITLCESFENGGKTEDTKEKLEEPYKEESPQKNVIPEGALHKNKHHMENAENLTQKGIPVIDNEGEQQAEIEKNEIIFTLEVTTKLEELMKDGSDEAAIEAGKLLVEQILFNTDDRTGLINTLKQGGKINEVS